MLQGHTYSSGRSIKATLGLHAEFPDEEVDETAEVLVQLDEEVLVAHNLDESPWSHCVAAHARVAIGVYLLCGQERGYGSEVAGGW